MPFHFLSFRHRSGSTLRVLLLLGSIPLAIVLCLAVWWMGRNATAQRKVDRRIADLRARKMPVDDASLLDYYRGLASSRNAGAWQEIFDQLEDPSYQTNAKPIPVVGFGPPGGPQEIPPPSQPYPVKKEVAAFLQQQQALLDQIHELTDDAEPVRYPIKLEGYATLLPWMQPTRAVARLLKLQHDHAVYEGDSATASRAIRSILGTAKTLRSGPIIVSQLVQMAIHAVAINALNRSLEHDLLSDEQLQRVLSDLDAFEDHRPALQRALAGERAFALQAHRNPEGFTEAPSFLAASRPPDMLATLKLFEEAEAIAGEELDPLMKASAKLDKEFDQVLSGNMLQRLDTLLTSQMMPAMSAYNSSAAAQVMRNRLAKLAIGLRLFQHQEKRWPKRLAELEKVGLDVAKLKPLGNKPFGYRVTDDGVLLWGFRPDVHEWQGTSRQSVPDDPPLAENGDGEYSDWVWFLPSDGSDADPIETGASASNDRATSVLEAP